MSESARECEHPFFVSESCPHCRKLVSFVKKSELVAMQADRDAQAALVERMREKIRELGQHLCRFDTDENPCDEATWADDYGTEYYEGYCTKHKTKTAKPIVNRHHKLLELTPSSALQEFKERCWDQAIEATMTHVHNGGNLANDTEATTASIVAELKKEGR